MQSEIKPSMDMEPAETEIDLLEIAHYLLQKIWVLIIGCLIGALIAGLYTVTMITPQYNASSMIYIYSKTTSITSLTDLQMSNQLAVDFQIVATTREVIDNVIESMGLNTTYEAMRSKVSITNPSNSHILKITATDPDPEMAAKISNTLADELRSRIADVMNTDEPSIVEHAYIPVAPSSPSVTKNVALGGIAVTVVIAGIYIVMFLMDDTIKTGDDARKYLGLNVLAEIPIDRSQKPKSKSTGKKKAG